MKKIGPRFNRDRRAEKCTSRTASMNSRSQIKENNGGVNKTKKNERTRASDNSSAMRGGRGGGEQRIAEQRARPILFRRRGILTHRGTRINVDMDFAGRVALFVTQCNGERVRACFLSSPNPISRAAAHSPVRFPPYFYPRRHRSEAARLFVPGYSAHDARQPLSRIARVLPFAGFHLPK